MAESAKSLFTGGPTRPFGGRLFGFKSHADVLVAPPNYAAFATRRAIQRKRNGKFIRNFFNFGGHQSSACCRDVNESARQPGRIVTAEQKAFDPQCSSDISSPIGCHARGPWLFV
jgi:hypothetical protein